MVNNIHIEATFKGKSCLACVYMEEAVLDVLPNYGERIVYHRIDIFSDWGKKRFVELSCALFGEAGVYKRHRLAPIPGLFINGELYFDAIPSRDELEAAIEENLTRGTVPVDACSSGYPESTCHAESYKKIRWPT